MSTLEILTNLLVGQTAFPDEGFHAVREERQQAIKREKVWIIPVEYEGRPYPTSLTKDDGTVTTILRQPTIPAHVLEPIKPISNKGIVALHQHAGEFHLGKSEIAGLKEGRSGQTMRYGLELAQQGYLTLCFDFPAFEERQHKSAALQNEYGQEYESQEALLSGGSLMGRQVLDTLAAVDFLEWKGAKDIAIIGHSMGGSSSFYATASDPRIKVGISNCGTGSLRSVSEIPYVHNPAWCVRGFKQQIGELHELFRLIAPRPYLISFAVDDDEFTEKGVREFIEWGRKFYQQKDRLQMFSFAGGHGFPRESRENAYQFIKERL